LVSTLTALHGKYGQCRHDGMRRLAKQNLRIAKLADRYVLVMFWR
jgi:hypothetical protein